MKRRPRLKRKEGRLFARVGGGLLVVGIFAFWIWGGMVSMKAYDLQAVPREKADQVRPGMTHREVIDLMGRDATPFLIWDGFETSGDQSVRALSESAKANLEAQRKAACDPDMTTLAAHTTRSKTAPDCALSTVMAS